MLKLESVNKHYGKKHALKDYSYTFEAGIYTLLGPNGAGKSTLMNLITDNIRPDQKGTITYNGTDIVSLGKEYRAKLGFMPQQQGLYDAFTARRFLNYMSALKGLPRKETEKQIPRLLEELELSDRIDKKIGGFSGGMKQRLLIAQALLGDPEIVILDEPTAGLDPKQRVQIRRMVERLGQQEGKTVIISTHIISDIEQITKAVLIMKEGVLVTSGSVQELISALPPDKEHNLEQVYMTYFGEAGDAP